MDPIPPAVAKAAALLFLLAPACAGPSAAHPRAHEQVARGYRWIAERDLERAGVARYSALGQAFDPTRHEAIARMVSVDVKPGTVIAETMPGYLLHNRVLRAALVSVAAAPDEDN